jgi:hypothetical protein
MIAKGTTHNSGGRLAVYLITGKAYEKAELWELRGFLSPDIKEAFLDIHIMAAATQCEKPFFHVQVRNPEGEHLTREQWQFVAERIENRVGLKDQPRAIAFHVDTCTGDRHMHIAWSRIDEETMTARTLPFYKLRLKSVSRDLEKELGLTIVRNDRGTPVKVPTRNEIEQARRLGVDIHEVRETIRDCWDQSDNGRAFMAALADQGLMLARGDRRDFVALDHKGGTHVLTRRILSVTAAQIRTRMADIGRDQLPSVEQGRAQLEQNRKIQNQQSGPEKKAAIERQFGAAARSAADRVTPRLDPAEAEIHQAWTFSRDARSFAAALENRDMSLARVTKEEANRRRRESVFVREIGRSLTTYREGELVAITAVGQVYRFDQRTTGADPARAQKRLEPLEPSAFAGIEVTKRGLLERAVQREIERQLFRDLNSIDPGKLLDQLAGKARDVVKDLAGKAKRSVADLLPARPAPQPERTKSEARDETKRGVDRKRFASDPEYRRQLRERQQRDRDRDR